MVDDITINAVVAGIIILGALGAFVATLVLLAVLVRFSGLWLKGFLRRSGQE